MVKLVLGAATVVLSLSGASAAAPRSFVFGTLRAADVTPQVSTNWSGYAAVAPDGAEPLEFTDVTASWTQPKIKCSADRTDAVAFWVGIGGFDESSESLQQLGTAAECDGDSRTARYSVWWEIVPAASVEVPLKVAPGDKITAAVLVSGQKVTMSLKNTTRKTRFTKTITVTQPLDTASAEWIAEAPAACSRFGGCRVVPLTNFGTVTFRNAATIGNGHAGTMNDAAWSAVRILAIADDDAGRYFGRGDPLGPGVGAVPSTLSSDGRSFSVTWRQSVTPPAP